MAKHLLVGQINLFIDSCNQYRLEMHIHWCQLSQRIKPSYSKFKFKIFYNIFEMLIHSTNELSLKAAHMFHML